MNNRRESPWADIRRLDEDSWLQGIDFLLGMDLDGLQVCCPKCGRRGMLTSKWIRGPKVKPLYVFHKNGQNETSACPLDDAQAREARQQVTLAEQSIICLLDSADPYVLVSGGTDSLCTLDYLATLAGAIGKGITAIHVDTTVGFPEVKTYVKTVCEKLGIPLRIVGPKIDYYTLAKRWGIPAINCRWCCRELKIRPIRAFLATVDGPKIVFDGIRAVESSVRAKYLPVWFHPSFNCLSASPIFYWSDEDVRSYLKSTALPPSPSQELGTSGECWCGAYKRKSDFEKLYHVHPEIYRKLMDVERSNKHGFTFVYENGQRTSLEELETEILQGQPAETRAGEG